MRSKAVWALVALNALLLGRWSCNGCKPNAAYGQAAPRPSDYIMIPGTIVGGTGSLVYIIDTQNGLLSARFFDGNTIQDKMPPIELDRILRARPARRPLIWTLFGPSNRQTLTSAKKETNHARSKDFHPRNPEPLGGHAVCRQCGWPAPRRCESACEGPRLPGRHGAASATPAAKPSTSPITTPE